MRLKILFLCLFVLIVTVACGRETPPVPAATVEAVAIPTRPSEVSVVVETAVPTATVSGHESEPTATPAAEALPVTTAPCLIKEDWPTHTVQSGDTLGELAAAVGSSIAELAQANCLDNPNQLNVGQTLHVPYLPSTPQPESTATIVVWADYADVTFNVNLAHPAKWLVKHEDGSTRIEGDDGYIFITAMGGGSLDTLARNEANHSLLPYGADPTIEPLTLASGQPGRLILPSDDQPAGFNNIATIIAAYPQPIELSGREYTHVMVQANEPNIRFVLDSMSLSSTGPDTEPGTAAVPTINSFTAEIVEELDDGGRTVRFTWQGEGATYGRLTSGTAQRFMEWWEVEPSGTRMVQLNNTIFPDPVMTLQLFNETTGAEVTAQVQLEWPCQHAYFFSPAPEHCPANAVQTANGVYQSFENGFMIWRPDNINYIHVFYNDGTTRLFTDTWVAGQPESDPSLIPPSSLLQPVRGFGKVWRAHVEVRDKLGWATAVEESYTLNFQNEWRESLPGVSYVTLQNGNLIKITDTRWGLWE